MTKADSAIPPGTVPDARVRMRGLIAACAGNLVEWFDFFVYAYLAIYFAPSFFPTEDPTSQLLSTAAIFAVGFLMRPLGGWLFGWIADTHGRKTSMMISVAMMSSGSLLIALIPTYAQIGVFAPAVLLTARLLQGLSVGAEYGTGATYISEIATKGRRGFFGSFQYATIIAGQLLALLTVITLQQVLSPEALSAWGWRIPFFMGAAFAVVVVYLRRAMVETASSKEMHRKESGSIRGLMAHKRAAALVVVFTAGGSLYFYTFTTYMQKFLVNSVGVDKSTASFVMTSALICFMIAQPLFGMLADRIGVRTHMLLFTGLATLFTTPILFAIQSTTNPYVAFALILTGLLIAAFYTPISGLVKADLFPPSIRALGVGLPYAIGNAAFGGTAEYVALWFKSSGIETWFFYYVPLLAFFAFLASWLLPNLGKHGYLDGDGRIEENIRLSHAGRPEDPEPTERRAA
ncbi:MAG: alpha-ketoglutarate permease [Rhodovulum sulfidophilum]|uniref:Alpha-ketoglutarate permease n=1 Tax=Rhodovulum sulfidophilum TaxID=35806 RepID=A0A2W5N3F1_RHOSU|nr:MAG: alpha-ketoglutarate permease [Rhodovulum sulfidophilum]